VNGVYADTLDQALVQAWQNNPSLQSQRDSLAAAADRADEAQGGYYPQVKLFGGVGTAHSDVTFMPIPGFNLPLSYFDLNTRQVGVEADQTLYAGGKVSAGVDVAQHQRDAEAAKLHAIEQGVLLDTARAYMDVLQAQAVVTLEGSNEHVLQQAEEQAQANFDNGEVTHTDVDQAKARLAGTQATLIQAQGALTTAEATYERIVGSAPAGMQQPASLPDLPASQDEAVTLAERNYPVVAAEASAAAAESNADIASSALKPSLVLTAQVSRAKEPQFLFETLDTRSIMLNFSMPLYSGGALSSQEHAARHDADSYQQQLLDARRQARDQVISAWQSYQTATAGLAAIEVQIAAAQSAYDGVEAEYKEGERTTLDVLNAEQELLDAKVNEVRAKRDEIVAEYALKAAVGGLTAEQIKLPVAAAPQGG
jgi:outer membrane protein